MLSGHLTDADIERYRQRIMPVAELNNCLGHMAICDDCYRLVARASKLDDRLHLLQAELQAANNEESAHLSFQQIVAYTTNQLDEADREVLETHLEYCPDCDSEAADLRLFRAALHELRPQTSAPVESEDENRARRWRMFLRIPFQIAAMIVLGVLIAWLATNSLRSRTAKLEAELAELTRDSEAYKNELSQQVLNSTSLSARLSEIEQASVLAAPIASHRSGAGTAVTLSDGGRRLSTDNRGVVEATGLIPAKYIGIVESALNSGRLVVPAALFGSVSPKRSASNDDPLKLLGPVGEAVISNQPAFRWTPAADAQSYSIIVRDIVSDRQVESEQILNTEWTPVQPFESGHTYSWTVVVTLSDGKRVYVPGAGSPPVLFKVLSKAATAELERARVDSRGSHMLMAVLYARQGLLTEAEKELKALQSENRRASVITKLQRSLKRR